MAYGIIGIVVGVLGITVGVVLYQRSKKEKKPQVRMRSFNLISMSVTQLKSDKVKVTYSGEEVEDLTVTNIAFWNSGKEPIRREDIASTEPIRITAMNGCRILEADVIQTNNPSNNLKCDLFGNDKVLTSFEYLEKGDGAVIQVFHTGQNNDDLQFQGKIIGTKIGVEKEPFISKFMSNTPLYVGVLLIILGCILGFGYLSNHKQTAIGSLLLIPLIIYLPVVFYHNAMEDRKLAVPPSLDSFGKTR